MRLTFMSDLHLEFRGGTGALVGDLIAPATGDVLILAGDIFQATKLPPDDVFRAIRRDFAAPNILFTPGNHEYYGSDNPEETLDQMRAAAEKHGIHLLESGKVVEIEGKRFLGDTMWYHDSLAGRPYKHMMRDFREIKNLEPWVYQRNALWRRFLKRELREGDVVITHHLPHSFSTPLEYANSVLNPFFVSDTSDIIFERQPALWIHGHTHTQADYKLGSTRVICNPLGYPGEHKSAESFYGKRWRIEL